MPAHPLWGEVMTIVTGYGGGIVKLIEDVMDRLCFWSTDPSAFQDNGWPPPESMAVTAGGTGPPRTDTSDHHRVTHGAGSGWPHRCGSAYGGDCRPVRRVSGETRHGRRRLAFSVMAGCTHPRP